MAPFHVIRAGVNFGQRESLCRITGLAPEAQHAGGGDQEETTMAKESMSRIAGTLACATIFFLGSVWARANQQQLQALVAKHFIANHQAIPLHNNGKVKSGDVLKMPEEATYLSRDRCYKLPAVKYTSLNIDFIRTTSQLAGEVGGQVPTQKIAEIEAELKGKLRETATILIDPLSQEEPPKGYADLQKTTTGAPECAVIADIWAGKGQDKILVTRVFHGSLNAVSTIDVAGGLKVSAAIGEKKINDILGGKPHVTLKVDGSVLQLEYSKSPEPQSLAVQSALVNISQLTKIYLAYHTQQRGIQLEWLVYEYITGTEPGLLDSIRIALNSLLAQMEVRQVSAAAVYQSVSSGDGAVPVATATIPQEQWSAFATVAAAHEIVGGR
jgi:hypothetical protein